MNEKPEALRLAEFCEGNVLYQLAAAELRRLHQFAEDQIGRATAAEAALQMAKATHALKIAAVETQRDALLEALRHAAAIAHNGGLADMTEWQALVAVRRLTQPYFVRSDSITKTHDRLRAAIAKAEEQT